MTTIQDTLRATPDSEARRRISDTITEVQRALSDGLSAGILTDTEATEAVKKLAEFSNLVASMISGPPDEADEETEPDDTDTSV